MENDLFKVQCISEPFKVVHLKKSIFKGKCSKYFVFDLNNACLITVSTHGYSNALLIKVYNKSDSKVIIERYGLVMDSDVIDFNVIQVDKHFALYIQLESLRDDETIRINNQKFELTTEKFIVILDHKLNCVSIINLKNKLNLLFSHTNLTITCCDVFYNFKSYNILTGSLLDYQFDPMPSFTLNISIKQILTNSKHVFILYNDLLCKSNKLRITYHHESCIREFETDADEIKMISNKYVLLFEHKTNNMAFHSQQEPFNLVFKKRLDITSDLTLHQDQRESILVSYVDKSDTENKYECHIIANIFNLIQLENQETTKLLDLPIINNSISIKN
jgi:hypothetical protein